MTEDEQAGRVSTIEEMTKSLIDSMFDRGCFTPSWDELDARLRAKWIEAMVAAMEALPANATAEYLADGKGFRPPGEYTFWLVETKANLLHQHRSILEKRALAASRTINESGDIRGGR